MADQTSSPAFNSRASTLTTRIKRAQLQPAYARNIRAITQQARDDRRQLLVLGEPSIKEQRRRAELKVVVDDMISLACWRFVSLEVEGLRLSDTDGLVELLLSDSILDAILICAKDKEATSQDLRDALRNKFQDLGKFEESLRLLESIYQPFIPDLETIVACSKRNGQAEDINSVRRLKAILESKARGDNM